MSCDISPSLWLTLWWFLRPGSCQSSCSEKGCLPLKHHPKAVLVLNVKKVARWCPGPGGHPRPWLSSSALLAQPLVKQHCTPTLPGAVLPPVLCSDRGRGPWQVLGLLQPDIMDLSLGCAFSLIAVIFPTRRQPMKIFLYCSVCPQGLIYSTMAIRSSKQVLFLN